jgi:hypothetical protein
MRSILALGLLIAVCNAKLFLYHSDREVTLASDNSSWPNITFPYNYELSAQVNVWNNVSKQLELFKNTTVV